MQLYTKSDPHVSKLLKRKRNKYVQGDYQNEIIRSTAFILPIANTAYVTSLKTSTQFILLHYGRISIWHCKSEQLIFWFRWIHAELCVHEDFVEIHAIENIKSDTIVAIIKGVFICFSIPLSNGYRQYYNGVNNITGYKKEVLTQILKKSPLVFLTHCYGLALNLPADGTITVERFWRDAMDTTDQLFILITKSPKRDIMLSEINEDRSLGNTGFRMLSSILWTMRALITGMLLTCYDIKTLWRS